MNSSSRIISIVEGPGDKQAVPGLVRRILYEKMNRFDIIVGRVIKANGKPGSVEKVERLLQYAILENCDGILVLFDADDECPYEEASKIANQAMALGLGVPVVVVYAEAEYESWFICNLAPGRGQEIRERLSMENSVDAPKDVENIKGAKEWLTRNMPYNRAYKETSYQEPLTQYIDLGFTQTKSRSFRRLCHAVEELVQAVNDRAVIATP